MPDRFGEPPMRGTAGSDAAPLAGGRITHGSDDRPIRKKRMLSSGERIMLGGYVIAGDVGIELDVAALPFGRPLSLFVDNEFVEQAESGRWRITQAGRDAYRRGWYEEGT